MQKIHWTHCYERSENVKQVYGTLFHYNHLCWLHTRLLDEKVMNLYFLPHSSKRAKIQGGVGATIDIESEALLKDALGSMFRYQTHKEQYIL